MNEIVVQKNCQHVSLAKTCLETFGWFLNQSSNLYSGGQVDKNLVSCCILGALPLLFIQRNNLYKGDNITRLTLNTPLLTFDTFDSSVTNKFKIMSRRIELDPGQVKLFLKNSANHTQLLLNKRHEEYPYISELWHDILITNTFGMKTIFALFKNKLSNENLKCLDNSEMFYHTTGKGELIFEENIDEIMDSTMEKCEKSAVILGEDSAIPLFSILTVKSKPTFFGKVIINENFSGYVFFGYFPTRLLLKPKYYFENGIIEWWSKYFKWALMMKTRADEIKTLNLQNKTEIVANNISSGVYVLSTIPMMGFLVSLFTFVFVDSSCIKGVVIFINNFAHSFNMCWRILHAKIRQGSLYY